MAPNRHSSSFSSHSETQAPHARNELQVQEAKALLASDPFLFNCPENLRKSLAGRRCWIPLMPHTTNCTAFDDNLCVHSRCFVLLCSRSVIVTFWLPQALECLPGSSESEILPHMSTSTATYSCDTCCNQARPAHAGIWPPQHKCLIGELGTVAVGGQALSSKCQMVHQQLMTHQHVIDKSSERTGQAGTRQKGTSASAKSLSSFSSATTVRQSRRLCR